MWKHRGSLFDDDAAMIDVFITDSSMSMKQEVELDADYSDISSWLRPKVMTWWNDHVINAHITGDSDLKTYSFLMIDVNTAVSETEFYLVANGSYKIGEAVKASELGFLPLIVKDGTIGSPHTIWVLPETIVDIKRHRERPRSTNFFFHGLDAEEHLIGSPHTSWRRAALNPDVVVTLNGENI